MNNLGEIDKITTTSDGFRVLSLNAENLKDSGKELLGVVRIISDPKTENKYDLLTKFGDQCLYNSFLNGNVQIHQVNLAELDSRGIASFFSKIMRTFQGIMINGHPHQPKSANISNKLDPNQPLLLIFGDCQGNVPHRKKNELISGLEFYEQKMKECKDFDMRRVSALTECCGRFLSAVKKDKTIQRTDLLRIKALERTIASLNQSLNPHQVGKLKSAEPERKVRKITEDKKFVKIAQSLADIFDAEAISMATQTTLKKEEPSANKMELLKKLQTEIREARDKKPADNVQLFSNITGQLQMIANGKLGNPTKEELILVSSLIEQINNYFGNL